jgi:hypothetical protein
MGGHYRTPGFGKISVGVSGVETTARTFALCSSIAAANCAGVPVHMANDPLPIMSNTPANPDPDLNERSDAESIV